MKGTQHFLPCGVLQASSVIDNEIEDKSLIKSVKYHNNLMPKNLMPNSCELFSGVEF